MASGSTFIKMAPDTQASSRITWNTARAGSTKMTELTTKVNILSYFTGVFSMNNKDNFGIYYDAPTDKKFMHVY